MSYSTEPVRLTTAPAQFFRHLVIMPGWHKGVLLIGFVLSIVGGAGWYMNHAAAKPQQSGPAVVKDLTVRPQGSSGFVTDAAPPLSTDSTASTTGANAAPTTSGGFLANLSPHTTKVGISIIAGFIFGWIFRAFLKTMALLAFLVFGAFAALSYFGVFNVDMTEAKTKYATAIQWATEQGWRLWGMLKVHLPSSSAGTVGAFLGFRRR